MIELTAANLWMAAGGVGKPIQPLSHGRTLPEASGAQSHASSLEFMTSPGTDAHSEWRSEAAWRDGIQSIQSMAGDPLAAAHGVSIRNVLNLVWSVNGHTLSIIHGRPNRDLIYIVRGTPPGPNTSCSGDRWLRDACPSVQEVLYIHVRHPSDHDSAFWYLKFRNN